MKHWILIAALGMILAAPARSQDTTGWKFGGAFGVNFSQVGLSHWSGGGENSLSLGSLLSLTAAYKQDKLSWDNTLDVAYGFVKQGKTGLRKSDDKIALTSKVGRTAAGYWNYSALLDFRTQFAKGYDYGQTPKTLISKFAAPAYVTLALGAEYKPNDNFFALLSPITGKVTIVADHALSDAGAFGVDSGKTVRAELGWLINTSYKRTVMEGIDFLTKLNLFAGYKDLKHVDVNWNGSLLMKVNKYVTTSFSADLVYDHDVKDPKSGKAKVQFKEVLAVGVLYKF